MNKKELLVGDFPIVVAFSGGKDSVAMVLHLFELGISPDRIHLHHHDVDGDGEKVFDWECTESYCKCFAAFFGLKLFFSYREGGIVREIYRQNEARQDVYYQVEPGGDFICLPSNKRAVNTRLKFPAVSASLMTRWCSSTVKIDVLSTVICHSPAYSSEVYILTGERREESASRSKYEETETYRAASKSRRAIQLRLIIDWTEAEVWAIMKRWKIQPHPAYMIGWSRCSCQLCIFNHPDLWATNKNISPKKVAAIANIEADISFTLYDNQTIYQKASCGKAFDISVTDYWVSQAIGEFTAPIIATEWQLPPGAYSTKKAGSM